jgi:tyrosine-protein kinase Etk/Wzc
MNLAKGFEDAREIDLKEWLLDLWGGRYVIAASIVGMMLLGGLFIWRSTPIYQVEALLQIEPPKAVRESDASFTRMENLFSAPSDVSTEIEIIGSNLVLGRTVGALNLDVVAKPVLLPLFGEAMARGKADSPRADVETFEIPDYMRGLEFQLDAMPDGTYAWKTPDNPPTVVGKLGHAFERGAVIAKGRAGDLLEGVYGGETLKLKLNRLVAKPGQRFRLQRRPVLAVITDLRSDLEAVEKGATQPNKTTNLLALTFRGTDPMKAADILNEIMRQYVRQNLERKNEEVSHTLDTLQQQLPEIHSRLTLAENRLNQFRARTGSVDIPKEAELTLQQSSNIGAQISALKQRKDDLLRTYQEGSDVVSTLNGQIARLESESASVNQKVRSLPGTQQELVRLSRDVQVNTELYTALLNNIQQLQVTGVGTAHNRVVDLAMPSLKPIKPKKEMLLAVFLALGMFLGCVLVLGRRAIERGVEDHRIIESKLGLPVLVTIPHSKAQEAHYLEMSKSLPGVHILAFHEPEDLATESLRSLRTTLRFSVRDGVNNAIMVTGPSPMVGKSFVSSNLSVVLAQGGARVLVVDADLRRGNLHRYFGLPNRMGGLSEVLSGEAQWRSSVRDTEIPGLQILSSGRIPKNPAELLMGPGFGSFIEEACREYDTVLIDAPPLLPVTDAAIIGSKVGSVLLVAKFGHHLLDELRTCQSRLESNGIPLNGCVFNDIMPTGAGYLGQQYRYAYHYKYGQA